MTCLDCVATSFYLVCIARGSGRALRGGDHKGRKEKRDGNEGGGKTSEHCVWIKELKDVSIIEEERY